MIEPRLRRDHVRDHVAPDDPRALEVDVDHRVPLGLGQLVGEPVGADAGVVEQQVDAAEALDRRGDGGSDRCVVADVGDRDQARGAGGLALALERLELGRGAHAVAGVLERRRDVERDDVVAGGGERERHRAALAVGGAGDERDRALAHASAPRYGSR